MISKIPERKILVLHSAGIHKLKMKCETHCYGFLSYNMNTEAMLVWQAHIWMESEFNQP